MGRIVTSVRVENVNDRAMSLRFDALVDTGASYLVLPLAWKERLGALEKMDEVDFEIADQSTVRGEICGPVRIEIEGFRPVFNEVAFVDMRPTDGIYEPLLGYIILEQAQAAVDVLGHRLVHGKALDLRAYA